MNINGPDIDMRVIQCDLTNYCNLQCIMCTNLGRWKNNDSYEKKVMEDSVWDSICQVKVKEIWFGFGYEPMVDRSIWQRIIKYNKLHPDTRFSMITNGITFDESDIDMIKNLPFRVVNISLNGGDRGTVGKIMGPHVWDQAWWTIKKLLSEVHIVISTVFLYQNKKSNYRLIDKLSEFNSCGVSLCIGFPNKIVDCIMEMPTSEEYHAEFKKYKEYGELKKIEVIQHKKEFDLEGTEEFWKKYKICPHLWRRLHISHNGDLFLCCEKPILLGHIRDKSIQDVFMGEKFSRARDLIWENEGPCKGCRVLP